jgi:hypothetical protein
MKRHLLYANLIGAALLLLQSCIKAIGPEPPRDEPDTAHSSVKMFVNVPNCNDTLTIFNNDTLSNSVVGRFSANGTFSTRKGDEVTNKIICT